MSVPAGRPHRPLEIWGGLECTVNRVGNRWFDQLSRSGHDVRADDLERMASLGLSAMRYPVLWERLAPRTPDEIDWRCSDRGLQTLRAHRIRPIVGLLHHGSGPAYTSLLDDAFPDRLARYAMAVASRYPWVTDFTPVNEPLTTARFSALYGHWFPHRRDDRDFVRALLNQLRGIVLAMRAIRTITPNARLLQTEDCGQTFGTGVTATQAAYETERRWLTFDLLAGHVTRDHPLWGWLTAAGATAADLDFFAARPCPPDVVGINYYVTSDRFLDERTERYPTVEPGGNGRIRYVDVDAVRARPDGIVGHELHLLAAWQRYRIPVAITEVHLACTREEQMRWLVESWRAAITARARGAQVTAITAWALLGAHDWDSLVTRDAGRYEPGVFDLRAPTPRPTALASVVRTLAAGQEPTHPVLSSAGWWRRPERLMVVLPRSAASAAGPPILIVGASGTLGQAFQRITTSRGLAARVLGRPTIDVLDPSRIDAAIRRLRPWAVINAAAYVHVDAAEQEPEACRKANVTGALNLAAACRRHGLKFVSFSSDLVFDGAVNRPYTEADTPAPLNVYGASKLEAEQRVLDLLPTALIVRTSAFFGPWDEANFVTTMLRTIDAGQRFLAASDTTVSPTYVPDLVESALDLLMDEEYGLWHLANVGAVTWYDFASMAAEACGRHPSLIEAATARDVWSPAVRPRYSALASSRGQVMRPLAEAVSAFVRARTSGAATTTESGETQWRKLTPPPARISRR